MSMKAGDTGLPPTTALQSALDRVGDRWSLLVVDALLDGPRRFGEIASDVSGIAPNILSDRLRRLERAGVVLAEVYTRRPPRFSYALSADGRELAGVLRLLAAWGGARRPTAHGEAAEPLRHAPCGTPLEARWYCPTCARIAEGGETGELRFL